MGSPQAEPATERANDAASSRIERTPSPGATGPATKQCPACQGRYPIEYRVCPKDATPLPDAEPSADPMLGSTLAGSYEVIRMIGEGAMGRVYEARHTRLSNKRYAVKLLHQDLSRHRDVISRFRQEAEAASAITHPNVIGVYDVNVTPAGLPYIVAEYLEGQELGDYVQKNGKVGVSVAVPIIRQVCRALSAAHQQGVVHRDIKPENIYLLGGAPGAPPLVKVLDFGISKVLEGETHLTKTGVIVGTPAFMAPEQARGERVGPEADIYSVGAVLYRLLTGVCPFEGLDQMGTLSAVMTRDPPRPSSLAPTVPSALELVIQRAMAKNIADRYSSMDEFDAALKPFDRSGSAADARSSVVDVETPIEALLTEESSPSLEEKPVLNFAEREIRAARPRVLVLSVLGSLGLGSLFLMGAGAVVEQVRGETGRLSAVEMTMVIVGGLGIFLTPAIWWWRYLQQNWENTPHCVALVSRLRTALLSGAAAYGAFLLLSRVVDLVIQRRLLAVRPLWEIGFIILALVAATLGWVRTNPRRAAD